MATEYRIEVVVDSGRAVEGSREFVRVMEDMSDAADGASKSLDKAGKAEKKFSDMLMQSASSVFTYKDTLAQLHEGLQAGGLSLARYARDVAGVSVALREAAAEGAALLMVLSDLNARGLKVGKLKEAAQGVSTPTESPPIQEQTTVIRNSIKQDTTPIPNVRPDFVEAIESQTLTATQVVNLKTDVIQEDVSSLTASLSALDGVLPIQEMVQPTTVKAELVATDTQELDQALDSLPLDEQVIMMTLDASEILSEARVIQSTVEDLSATLRVDADTAQATDVLADLTATESVIMMTLDASMVSRQLDDLRELDQRVEITFEPTLVNPDAVQLAATSIIPPEPVDIDVPTNLTISATVDDTSLQQALSGAREMVGGEDTATKIEVEVVADTSAAVDELRNLKSAVRSSGMESLVRSLNASEAVFTSVGDAISEVTTALDDNGQTVHSVTSTYSALGTQLSGAGDFGAGAMEGATGAARDLTTTAEDLWVALEKAVSVSGGEGGGASDHWVRVGDALREVVDAATASETAFARANDATAPLVDRLKALPEVVDESERAIAAFNIESAQMGRDLLINMEEVRESIDRATDSTGGFSNELALMAQDFAAAGDAVQASRLFEMSDQFRELEQHISDALAPGSALLQQFADSAGMSRDEVQALYNEFGQLMADMTESRLLFEQGKTSVEDYKREIEELNARVADLTPELADLRSQLQLDASAQDANAEVESMVEKLGSGQQQMEEFAKSQENAASAGDLLNNSMTTLGVSAGKLGGLFLRALGLTGMSAIFYKSFAGANEFANSLVKITNMADLTEEQVHSLTKEVKGLAEEFGNSSTQEAAALLSIMSKGYRDAADSVEILAQANRLADATFGSVTTSAAALSQAMAAFELDSKDAKDAADTLAVASGGSEEAMQQMAFMAGRLGAVMNQAGVSMEDYALAVSALRQGGMENRRAIMGLTQVVASLSDMSTEASLRFDDLGISVSKTRIAQEGLVPVLQEIYEKTGGSKDAIQQLVGSSTAATIIMALMRDEGALLAKSMDDMANKGERAREMADNVNATFTKLASDMGSRLLDRFKEFGTYTKDQLIPTMQWLTENIEGVFAVLKTLGAALAVTTVFGIVSSSAVGLVKSIATLRVAFGADMLAMKAMAATTSRAIVMAFNGLGLAIVAAIAGWELYKVFRDELSKADPAWAEFFTKLESYASKAFRVILGSVSYVVKALVTALQEGYGLISGGLHSALGGLLQIGAEAMSYLPGMSDQAEKMMQTGQQWSAYGEQSMGGLTQAMTELNAAFVDFVFPSAQAADNVMSLGNTADTVTGKVFGLASAMEGLSAASASFTLEAPKPAVYPARMLPTPQLGPEVQETVTFGGDSLQNKQLGEARQVVSSDPYFSIQKQIREKTALRDAVANAINVPDKDATLAALGRELANLNVEAMKLAQSRSPAEEFFRGVAAAADPAIAAAYAYEDRLRELAAARGLMFDDAYNQQVAAAAVAYMEAAEGAKVFREELIAVETAVDPSTAAMEEFQKAAITASKAAVAGADPEAIQKFMEAAAGALDHSLTLIRVNGDSLSGLVEKYQPLVALENERKRALAEAAAAAAASTMAEEDKAAALALVTAEIEKQTETQRRLLELQSDGLVQLAAQYDPLIANEVARTKALIEMEDLLNRAGLSEQERMSWAVKATEVINAQYDQQARTINGNITLADAWKKAWESAIERIDGSFAELWKSMFDGTKAFMDQLKDTFKQLVAEIAHAKITRPLIMKAKEIFSGEPKAGEVFGEGKTGDVMKRLLGVQEAPKGGMSTVEGATKAVHAGTYAALKQAGLVGGVGAEVPLGYMDGLEEIAITAERIGGSLGGIGDKISQAMDSISLEGLTSGVQEAFGSAVQRYFPMAGGAGSSGGVGSASGGFQQYFQNAPGLSKMLQGMGKFGATLSAFSGSFAGGANAFFQGGAYSAGQIGNMFGIGLEGGGATLGTAGVGAGYLAGAAGTGLAAGSITNKLAGERGNATRNAALSVAGGIIGTFVFPGLGTVVGAALGGAIGSLVDNVIGGGEKIKDFGYKIYAEGTSLVGKTYKKIEQYGAGFSSKTIVREKEWNSPVLDELTRQFKTMRDMIESLSESLKVSADVMADFDAEIKVSSKHAREKKHPGRMDARLEQARVDLLGQQASYFLKETNAISPEFEDLLETFTISGKELVKLDPLLKKQGNAFKRATHYTEEYLKAFEQLTALQIALNTVPTTAGQELVDEANKTSTERYRDLADAAIEAGKHFDGTVDDITKVTTAFVAQRQAATELAAALLTVRDSIHEMFTDTATTIRESLMDPDELYNFRRSMVDSLTAELRTETDPGRMSEIASEINSLVNSLYQGLDETQREQMAPEFLSYLEGVDAIVREQTQTALQGLDQEALTINEALMGIISQGLEGIAEEQSKSAGVFKDSVGDFASSVGFFGSVIAQLAEVVAEQKRNKSGSDQPASGNAPVFDVKTPRRVFGARVTGLGEVNA